MPDLMLLADVDWSAVLTTGASVLTVAGGAVAGLLKLVLSHLKDQRKEQREHETLIMTRVEGLADKFDLSVREFRAEQRQTIDTLLKIQGETVEAVSDLGHRVSDLGSAIHELRTEVGRIMDRPGDHP